MLLGANQPAASVGSLEAEQQQWKIWTCNWEDRVKLGMASYFVMFYDVFLEMFLTWLWLLVSQTEFSSNCLFPFSSFPVRRFKSKLPWQIPKCKKYHTFSNTNRRIQLWMEKCDERLQRFSALSETLEAHRGDTQQSVTKLEARSVAIYDAIYIYILYLFVFLRLAPRSDMITTHSYNHNNIQYPSVSLYAI